MDTIYFDFYITGTPRSGSAWLSTLFTAHDFICLHEPTFFNAEWILSQLKIRKTGAACPSFVYLDKAGWLIDERSKLIILNRKDWKEAYAKFLDDPSLAACLGAGHLSIKSKNALIESLVKDFEKQLDTFNQYVLDKKIDHVTINFEEMFSDTSKVKEAFSLVGCNFQEEKFIQMKDLKITTNRKLEF